MKVELINKVKDAYKKALMTEEKLPNSLLRHCIQHWKSEFDIEEMHLAPVLDRSLKSKISGRLWGGEKHSIKSGLIQLSKHNPDLFWTSLKDLFNDERMIIMRASRFMHHCDEIFADLRRKEEQKSKKTLTTHHQSYYSISLLLTLQYPHLYCPFDFERFSSFCKKIGVQDIPVDTDLERYYKIMRIVNTLISKDRELMELYYTKLDDGLYLGPSLDIVYGMM